MRLPAYGRGITRHPLVAVPPGMTASERRARVSPEAHARVAALVSSWEFKRRAGFEVPSDAPVPDAEGVLVARLLGMRFSEPVRVVWADARGFGYETRPGHPIYGEESFRLDDDGWFSARSVSRSSTWFWMLVSPALRLLQRRAHDRYVRIVQDAAAEV
ncbi:DUF1990 family protein [Microbacterium sp. 179-I 3D3 NHS]|uniref:DUF1990 family protein n=1 Tax=Microbacterium sp. 179-I 3D3 NHS TaxID=3142382 RepID=UPI0039A27829